LPDKKMMELRELSLDGELFPGSGINLASDTPHIKKLLGQDQAFGGHADVIDVVVPTGMFAESCQVNVPSIARRSARCVLQQESPVKGTQKS
jgi:hypothetical protein